ncbi:MAG TPA: LysR family transcriptional regulator [Bacillales bacterium]|nr:LysR family transcriptional regulator [Bacillales bacterium]
MELRQVKYFVAVAEELHFGRAARKVNIAQPALSQQIIRLEEEVGGRLFTRNKRNVSLTDAGKILLPEAKLLLSQSEHAQETVKRAFSGKTGELVLGFVESAIWEVMPRALRLYRQKCPEVKIKLLKRSTADQIQAIQDGNMHVGITGVPVDNDNLSVRVIKKEPFLVALPESHRLAAKTSLHVAELAREPFIATVRDKGQQYYDAMVKVCMDAGFSPSIVQEANEIQTVLSLVSSEIGIALIHESARYLRNDIMYKPLSGIKQHAYEMSFVWKKGEASPVVKEFLEII